MKTESSLLLKKYGYLILFFTCIVVFLAIAQVLTGPLADRRLKTAIEAVLVESYPDKKLGDKMLIPSGSWEFLKTWKAGNDAVLAIRITGKAGPYTGVFLYTDVDKAKFLGIAGMSNSKGEGRGVSPFSISVWENKINAILKSGVQQK